MKGSQKEKSSAGWLKIALLALFFWVSGVSILHAEKVALLPLADISIGGNGVNLEFTQDVESAILRKGFELVPETEVVRFMVQNRVRFSGYIDSFLVRKMGRELGCSLVLLGTVTEMGGKKDPSIGLTLSALDAETGKPVWAGTSSKSLAEGIRLLGLGQPEGLADLKTPLLDDLLKDFSRKIASVSTRAGRFYQLVSLQIYPDHLQGGSEIDCCLKIRFLETQPEKIALETGSGKVYLYRGKNSDVYRGRWTAPQEEGKYPVSLALEWVAGKFVERLTDLASYEVMNAPPPLTMDLKKGLRIGDLVAFRHNLLILPSVVDSSQVSRWALEVKNGNGGTVLYYENEGRLPLRMVWKGQDGNQRRLQDGVYELCISVWDAAGNEADVARKVALQSAGAPVSVATVQKDGKTYLEIKSASNGVVPVTSWTLNATNQQGQLLVKTEGVSLPALLELPLLGSTEPIYCDLEVKDRLGNRTNLRAARVEIESDKSMLAQKEQRSGWIEDF